MQYNTNQHKISTIITTLSTSIQYIRISNKRGKLKEDEPEGTTTNGLITQKAMQTSMIWQHNRTKKTNILHNQQDNKMTTSFTHQTAMEIMSTRHVQAPDDLEDITSSRECYLQILSMAIVADQETKENNGNKNDSITHLLNESSRLETRLIELCSETFEDIKSGNEAQWKELFNIADYKLRQEEDREGTESNNPAKTHKVTQNDDEKMSYLDKAISSRSQIKLFPIEIVKFGS